ncbi:uncharacterized protein MYCFIDRAFT_179778 [Pseudocercospora fijiensis CIRAD86]|uniref:Uncharacterized protein n=1 Tax=Pseudocercospora fijiensis (strain CIRAD86) TaxID=383855 RepID=M2ZZD5_PSEFD|nr:uncharacterized protein MYCFIDRAFT_179778 [Pseudocercospora fijiensis CIRAD86]EME77526.1 hypothetical protein MYCFIDRAFT_179778 [Pseudocercospora fijiensis CIRAD86]
MPKATTNLVTSCSRLVYLLISLPSSPLQQAFTALKPTLLALPIQNNGFEPGVPIPQLQRHIAEHAPHSLLNLCQKRWRWTSYAPHHRTRWVEVISWRHPDSRRSSFSCFGVWTAVTPVLWLVLQVCSGSSGAACWRSVLDSEVLIVGCWISTGFDSPRDEAEDCCATGRLIPAPERRLFNAGSLSVGCDARGDIDVDFWMVFNIERLVDLPGFFSTTSTMTTRVVPSVAYATGGHCAAFLGRYFGEGKGTGGPVTWLASCGDGEGDHLSARGGELFHDRVFSSNASLEDLSGHGRLGVCSWAVPVLATLGLGSFVGVECGVPAGEESGVMAISRYSEDGDVREFGILGRGVRQAVSEKQNPDFERRLHFCTLFFAGESLLALVEFSNFSISLPNTTHLISFQADFGDQMWLYIKLDSIRKVNEVSYPRLDKDTKSTSIPPKKNKTSFQITLPTPSLRPSVYPLIFGEQWLEMRAQRIVFLIMHDELVMERKGLPVVITVFVNELALRISTKKHHVSVGDLLIAAQILHCYAARSGEREMRTSIKKHHAPFAILLITAQLLHGIVTSSGKLEMRASAEKNFVAWVRLITGQRSHGLASPQLSTSAKKHRVLLLGLVTPSGKVALNVAAEQVQLMCEMVNLTIQLHHDVLDVIPPVRLSRIAKLLNPAT